MPLPDPKWKKWEKCVQEALGLRSTIASGNQFYDISDGVTPRNHVMPFMVDAKSTEKKSYSINAAFMEEWVQKAAEQGFGFLLPVRFENASKTKEYMVMTFEDFQTLWQLAQKYLEQDLHD
jgi:hypothetical protein